MLVQRLVCESLNAGSEAVAVEMRPVDAAVRRLWVVLDRELDHACDVVAGQFGRQSQSGIDSGGHTGASEVAAVLYPGTMTISSSGTSSGRVVAATCTGVSVGTASRVSATTTT